MKSLKFEKIRKFWKITVILSIYLFIYLLFIYLFIYSNFERGGEKRSWISPVHSGYSSELEIDKRTIYIILVHFNYVEIFVDSSIIRK